MMGHKICFYEEICIIIPILSLLLLLIWSTDYVNNIRCLNKNELLFVFVVLLYFELQL